MIQAAGLSRWSIPKFRTQLLLLAAWAVLSGLSFPWPNLWPLAHVALVPLTLVGLFSVRPGRMMLAVYLVGAAWWLIMLRWMIPVTGPGTVGLAFYKAIYVFMYVNLLRLAYRRTRVPLTLSVPVIWVGLEYLRGQVMLSGFPWFYLGHSQPVVLIQIADVVGAPGVSFLVAMTSGVICDVLTRPLVKTPGAGTTPLRSVVPVWLVLMLATAVYGMWRTVGEDLHVLDHMLLAHESPAELRIAIVQSNVPQSNKDSHAIEDEEATFQQMLALSEAAMRGDPRPDLIVWPETMVPRPIDEESIALFTKIGRPELARYRGVLGEFAASHKVAMVVGAHAMLGWHESGNTFVPERRYNSAYLIDATGRVADRYDKVHRVPFGEYIPWVDDFPTLKKWMLSLTPYDHDYTLTPGSRFNRFELEAGGRTWHIGAPVCFEDVMSYVPRAMVWGVDGDGTKKGDVLVNITNDGWFTGSSQSLQHEQIGRFRCVENRVSEARAVNTGVSGVLDSCGRLVARVEVDGKQTDVAGVAVATVTYDPRVTVFGRVGDLFAVVCTVAMVLLTAWAVIRKLSVKSPSAR